MQRGIFLTDSQQEGKSKSHEFHDGGLQHQEKTVLNGSSMSWWAGDNFDCVNETKSNNVSLKWPVSF